VSDRAGGKTVLTPDILMFVSGSGISRAGNRFLLDPFVGVEMTKNILGEDTYNICDTKSMFSGGFSTFLVTDVLQRLRHW
jgi:hypothetical protein